MLHKKLMFSAAVFFVSMLMLVNVRTTEAGKPTVGSSCKQCHQPQEDVVRGTLVSVSDKFRTVQVAVGSLVWVIKYGDDLALTGAAKLSDIPKDKEIGVKFTGGDKTPYAVNLSVKPPAKLPAEKLVSADELSTLIALGPEKGNFLLLDSRPAARYVEGHIAYAVSMPQPAFDSLKDKVLPKEKDKLIIFYCGGVT